MCYSIDMFNSSKGKIMEEKNIKLTKKENSLIDTMEMYLNTEHLNLMRSKYPMIPTDEIDSFTKDQIIEWYNEFLKDYSNGLFHINVLLKDSIKSIDRLLNHKNQLLARLRFMKFVGDLDEIEGLKTISNCHILRQMSNGYPVLCKTIIEELSKQEIVNRYGELMQSYCDRLDLSLEALKESLQAINQLIGNNKGTKELSWTNQPQ